MVLPDIASVFTMEEEVDMNQVDVGDTWDTVYLELDILYSCSFAAA